MIIICFYLYAGLTIIYNGCYPNCYSFSYARSYMAYKEIYSYMCILSYSGILPILILILHMRHGRPAHVNRQHFHLTQVIVIVILLIIRHTVDSQAVICLEEDRIRQMTTRTCIPAAGCPRALTLMAYAVQQPSVGSHLALRALRPHRSGSVCARPRRF